MKSDCFRLAASFAVLLMGAAVADAATTGACSPTKTNYLATDSPGAVGSTTVFSDIAEGTLTFTQGGTSRSCVIVQFFADTQVQNNTIYVRPLLDGNVGTPQEARYLSVLNFEGGARSMAFVYASVAPGKHTIRIQFRTDSTANNIAIYAHSILVLHR